MILNLDRRHKNTQILTTAAGRLQNFRHTCSRVTHRTLYLHYLFPVTPAVPAAQKLHTKNFPSSATIISNLMAWSADISDKLLVKYQRKSPCLHTRAEAASVCIKKCKKSYIKHVKRYYKAHLDSEKAGLLMWEASGYSRFRAGLYFCAPVSH